MIDRKALWIILALATTMLAAAVWRTSLLSDWTLFPIDGSRTLRHSYFALFLFVPPLWVISCLGILAIKRWLRRGMTEEIQLWQKFNGNMLVPITGLLAMMQFFMIARSLGLAGTIDRMMVARAFLVATGLWMMVIGNGIPKLPWLTSRFAILELPPAQGAKLLRFSAWLQVGIGAVYVLGGLFLPAKILMTVIAATVVAAIAMGLVRRIQLKREHHHEL